MARIAALRGRLITAILNLPRTRLTVHPVRRLPSIASFTFETIEGKPILLQLDGRGICASSGSACSSTSLEPFHVLLSIGLPHEVAHGSVQLSLGNDVTEADVGHIVQSLIEVVNNLRAKSPMRDAEARKTTW